MGGVFDVSVRIMRVSLGGQRALGWDNNWTCVVTLEGGGSGVWLAGDKEVLVWLDAKRASRRDRS
jgi:hypothetical protein